MPQRPEPYSALHKDSFAYESTETRWPIILKGVIKAVQEQSDSSDDSVHREEGARINAQVEQLIQDIGTRKELAHIPDDGGFPSVAIYNAELDRLRTMGQSSWETGPWLHNECYLYRFLRTFFARTQTWKDFDPFRKQKQDTFSSSAAGVMQLIELASTFQGAHQDPSSQITQANFFEMVQCGLWANATDLSLLTSLSHEDIIKLQSGSTSSKMSNLIKNDSARLWEYFSKLRDGRADIVFDNSGFEVFADLVFADWMVTKTPFVKVVHLHPKTIPWFVSDVINGLDIDDMFQGLEALKGQVTDKQRSLVDELIQRWQSYFQDGTFKLTTPARAQIGDDAPLANFWCGPFDFPSLPKQDPTLLSELQKSDLVIFKGDLNYRKLTSDATWPADTPFEVALGDLNGRIPILSLRTCKADVVVGLKSGEAEALDAKDPKWRVNGKWALISFAPRQS